MASFGAKAGTFRRGSPTLRSELTSTTAFTALEFYSGIGGMRAALNVARNDTWKTTCAYDVNEVTRFVLVYRFVIVYLPFSCEERRGGAQT